jgi:hypothetical protein
MYKVFIPICLILASLPATAIEKEAGEEYRNWCKHSAKAEKVAFNEQAEFIQACIDTLVQADSKPDKSVNRGKRQKQNDID